MTGLAGTRLLASAAALAFPRRAGSEGSRRVVDHARAVVEKLMDESFSNMIDNPNQPREA